MERDRRSPGPGGGKLGRDRDFLGFSHDSALLLHPGDRFQLQSGGTWIREFVVDVLKAEMSISGSILVAEDDAADAYFLQRAFSRSGIPVHLQFVRDGQEALDYLRGEGPFADRSRHPMPHLVLLDLKMPRLDGFDVLEWIRKEPAIEHLVVVIFSSSDEPRDIGRAYTLGANDYLVKPHSIEELNRLVGRFKKLWELPQGGRSGRAA